MTKIRFTNVKQFEKDLRTIAREFEDDIELVISNVALRLYAGITKRTPVDLGYARANWNLSIGDIDTSTTPRDAWNDGGEEAATSINDARASQFAQQSVLTTPRVWITNSVPYIIFLEMGRTKQIDQDRGFMVQRTFATVQKAIFEEAKNIRNFE